MRLRKTRNRIPWIYRQTRPNHDGPKETSRHQRLACTKDSETSTILPRIQKFLQAIHQGILLDCQTINEPHEEGSTVRVDPTLSTILRNAQKEIPLGTRIKTTRPRTTILSGS